MESLLGQDHTKTHNLRPSLKVFQSGNYKRVKDLILPKHLSQAQVLTEVGLISVLSLNKTNNILAIKEIKNYPPLFHPQL